jgi:hypothetical protein
MPGSKENGEDLTYICQYCGNKPRTLHFTPKELTDLEEWEKDPTLQGLELVRDDEHVGPQGSPTDGIYHKATISATYKGGKLQQRNITYFCVLQVERPIVDETGKYETIAGPYTKLELKVEEKVPELDLLGIPYPEYTELLELTKRNLKLAKKLVKDKGIGKETSPNEPIISRYKVGTDETTGNSISVEEIIRWKQLKNKINEWQDRVDCKKEKLEFGVAGKKVVVNYEIYDQQEIKFRWRGGDKRIDSVPIKMFPQQHLNLDDNSKQAIIGSLTRIMETTTKSGDESPFVIWMNFMKRSDAQALQQALEYVLYTTKEVEKLAVNYNLISAAVKSKENKTKEVFEVSGIDIGSKSRAYWNNFMTELRKSAAKFTDLTVAKIKKGKRKKKIGGGVKEIIIGGGTGVGGGILFPIGNYLAKEFDLAAQFYDIAVSLRYWNCCWSNPWCLGGNKNMEKKR